MKRSLGIVAATGEVDEFDLDRTSRLQGAHTIFYAASAAYFHQVAALNEIDI
jgi:hypothetical protein